MTWKAFHFKNLLFPLEIALKDMKLVARERRRDDRPPSKNMMGIYISGQCGETRNSLSLSSER
jgi:hypothetical protein